MSHAIPTLVRKGKKTDAIYALIKNGNVYRLNARVNPTNINQAIDKILTSGRIRLKHWTKC